MHRDVSLTNAPRVGIAGRGPIYAFRQHLTVGVHSKRESEIGARRARREVPHGFALAMGTYDRMTRRGSVSGQTSARRAGAFRVRASEAASRAGGVRRDGRECGRHSRDRCLARNLGRPALSHGSAFPLGWFGTRGHGGRRLRCFSGQTVPVAVRVRSDGGASIGT